MNNDTDKIDIIIHPLYELKQHNILDSQVNFKGKKKNLQYIIPINKNHIELHIYIKDFLYEIDANIIFITLNILYLQKNNNEFKKNILKIY